MARLEGREPANQPRPQRQGANQTTKTKGRELTNKPKTRGVLDEFSRFPVFPVSRPPRLPRGRAGGRRGSNQKHKKNTRCKHGVKQPFLGSSLGYIVFLRAPRLRLILSSKPAPPARVGRSTAAARGAHLGHQALIAPARPSSSPEHRRGPGYADFGRGKI